MVRARLHQVAHNIKDDMTRRASHTLATVEESASRLREVGVEIPSWEALAAGARPQGDVMSSSGNQQNSAMGGRGTLQ